MSFVIFREVSVRTTTHNPQEEHQYVLRKISFSLPRHSFLVLLGRSESRRYALLQILANHVPHTGEVYLGSLLRQDNNAGVMPKVATLFGQTEPHTIDLNQSVQDYLLTNVDYADQKDVSDYVFDLAERLHIAEYAGLLRTATDYRGSALHYFFSCKLYELTAQGRFGVDLLLALRNKPDLLAMCYPFRQFSRDPLMQRLAKLQHKLEVTIVCSANSITPLQESLSHVAVLEEERLSQFDTVDQIFIHPRTEEVVRQIYDDRINILRAILRNPDRHYVLQFGGMNLDIPEEHQLSHLARLRPEYIDQSLDLAIHTEDVVESDVDIPVKFIAQVNCKVIRQRLYNADSTHFSPTEAKRSLLLSNHNFQEIICADEIAWNGISPYVDVKLILDHTFVFDPRTHRSLG